MLWLGNSFMNIDPGILRETLLMESCPGLAVTIFRLGNLLVFLFLRAKDITIKPLPAR